MAFNTATAETAITGFFDDVKAALNDNVTARDLPLVGMLGNDVAGFLDTLETKILDAIDAVPAGGDVVSKIVEAINGLNLPAVEASKNDGGGIDLHLKDGKSVTTGSVAIDADLAILKFDATTAAVIKAALDATISIDEDGHLSLKDQAAPELTVDVSADFSLNTINADIGVVKAVLTDFDAAAPELTAKFNLDFKNGPGDTITVDHEVSGSAKLDVKFASNDTLFGLLPDLSGRLLVDYDLSDPTAAPTVSVQDVLLDLKSYLSIVGDTASEVGDLFNAGALAKIVDIATAPVPVLNDIASVIPGLMGKFDKVGDISGGGDGTIQLGDLAVGIQPATEPFISPFYQLLAIINILRTFDKLGDAGGIAIGGGSLGSDGTVTSAIDKLGVADSLKSALGSLADDLDPDDFAAVFDYLTESLGSDGMKTMGLEVGESNGFTFNLIENPDQILNLLFKPDVPVDLVTFDVPTLSLGTGFSQFFPVLGPLGFELGGNVGAMINIDVGYDTGGLISGKIEDGFFFSTPPAPGGWSDFPAQAFAPAGELTTGLFGGAGASFGFGSVTVRAGFDFKLDAFLGADAMGKFRPSVDPIGCIFSPISGVAGVSVKLHFELGFGPFSVSKNVPLAEATLANFDIFKCPPPTVTFTPEAQGLASVVGAETLLNVGARADLREVKDREDGEPRKLIGADDPNTPEDDRLNEGYIIARARDTADDGTVTVHTDAIDIFAFGVTQRVTSGGTIKADFADGADQMIIQTDVLTPAVVHGGGGDDLLTGGAGNDTLYGDDQQDVLNGGDGDDHLFGGSDNDQLSGGKGADELDGGDGQDTVDYSQANRDVKVGVTVKLSDANIVAFGGEATGDTLKSIENVIGTDYNDNLNAEHASFKVYLEGGLGNDTLIGGDNQDYLQGGAGGDFIDGGKGEDLTTYMFSWAGVSIDLNSNGPQHGGDAEGDYLRNLEDIQGTVFNDRIIGNALDNKFIAGSGNDVLDGGAGHDELYGGDGDDTVYVRGDGDLVDGGFGINLLSYEFSGKAVTVDLGASQRNNGSFHNAPDNIAMIIRENGAARGYSSFQNLRGSIFADTLTGDIGNNRIEGGLGNDTLHGDEGSDILVGGIGADTLDGGGGDDWASYSDSYEGVAVSLERNAVNSGGTATGDVFTFDYNAVYDYYSPTIENLLGSRYGDTLLGNMTANVIDPNISGQQVTETVDGAQTLRVNYSSVEADVGQGVTGGFTNYIFNQSVGKLQRLTADGAAVLDTVNFTRISHLDLVGTRFADTIYGGARGDRIVTGDGDDFISSSLGADQVDAGNGNDTVIYGQTLLAPDDGGIGVFDAFPDQTRQLFRLNGGAGIDTLSFVGADYIEEDIVITGGDGVNEFNGVNLRITASGAAAYNFEILRDVETGYGNDRITQLGQFDNIFNGGDGNDVITPGLGRDSVDGGYNSDGLSYFFTDENGNIDTTLEDVEAVRASGDKLVLDYSTLGPDQRVVSAVVNEATFSAYRPEFQTYTAFSTNNGRYVTLDTERYGAEGMPDFFPRDAENDLRFRNIERMDVTGSGQNDIIVGAGVMVSTDSLDFRSNDRLVGGDDVLRGGGGDDLIYGQGGNDQLFGGDGDDVLQGTVPWAGESYYELYEIDTLTGGGGSDTFVLGLETYSRGERPILYSSGFNGDPSRAVITDFSAAEGDHIQLFGSASDYLLVESGSDTLIYVRDPEYGPSLIGEVKGVRGLDLASDAFFYVNNGPSLPAADRLAVTDEAAVATDTVDRAATPDFPVLAAAAPAATALADTITTLDAGFTVTQESSADTLKGKLDAGSGVVSSMLSLSGSAQGFGTFAGDPFGLGDGVILSTGRATDLPGPNMVSTGGTALSSLPITFTYAGRTGEADIFRADLSGLGVDLRSITLRDSGSLQGGAAGSASGFDLGAIALSTKLILDATGLDLDNSAVLPRLDVFDFSNASMIYTAGGQHGPAPDNYPYLTDLPGSLNGLVDQANARLDLFNGPLFNNPYTGGTLTLGDSGSIGFNLTQAVSADGPLYLYIAESGGSGEIVSGTIDVSSDTVERSGDLSTDLGAPGLDGDTTAMTYRFTPKAGDNAFSMNVVLFTEELPEFDGTNLTDLFSIKLNGVEIGALNNGNGLSINALALSANDDLVYNDPGTGPLADQIRADAYTRTLRISGSLLANSENELTIEVRDQHDAYLDSGLLIQSGSLKTFVRPEVAVDFGGGAAGVGSDLPIVVTIPDGTDGTTTVTLTPNGNIDLGGGAGNAVVVTFEPGDSPTKTVTGTVVDDADPDTDGIIGVAVDSDDPDVDGAPVPPGIIDITPSTVDPYLIFERLSGDLVEGFTSGNNAINATALPGPSSFHVEGLATGKDVITGFGKSDILIVDEALYDSNNDGIITPGRNGVLDLDGPDKGLDSIQFKNGPKNFRLLGHDDEGHWVYSDASVRPKGAKEGTLADNLFKGDTGDMQKDIFFFDTNLDVNWGGDRIENFGAKDFIVTTSRLFEAAGDGRVVLDAGALGLSGNPFFDATHIGDAGSPSPFGTVEVEDGAGEAVERLFYDGEVKVSGVSYFLYSTAFHAATSDML